MSKAVMKSVPPRQCKQIASGECTMLLSKTKPKTDTPFKCYIYCIRPTNDDNLVQTMYGYDIFSTSTYFHIGNSNCKVIGEFVCDKVNEFNVFENGAVQYWSCYDLENSCLDYNEIAKYIGNNKKGYAWTISQLKIYAEPKELSEFFVIKQNDFISNCDNCPHGNGFDKHSKICDFCLGQRRYMTRPPQSWCYVEELEE